MNKKSLWVLAATLICCIGMFTSCSKDDDNPVNSVDLETIPLEATLTCLQTDGESIQMENKGDGLFETTFIEVKDASNLNATVTIRYQVPGGFEKTITKEFAISHDDCPAQVGDKIRYILDANIITPKLTAEIFDTNPTEERIVGRWRITDGGIFTAMTINADHTITIDHSDGNYSGTWTLNGNIFDAETSRWEGYLDIKNTKITMLADNRMRLVGYYVLNDHGDGSPGELDAIFEREQQK